VKRIITLIAIIILIGSNLISDEFVQEFDPDKEHKYNTLKVLKSYEDKENKIKIYKVSSNDNGEISEYFLFNIKKPRTDYDMEDSYPTTENELQTLLSNLNDFKKEFESKSVEYSQLRFSSNNYLSHFFVDGKIKNGEFEIEIRISGLYERKYNLFEQNLHKYAPNKADNSYISREILESVESERTIDDMDELDSFIKLIEAAIYR
jgi:hypothetical protein